jgi:hypothetical protein
MDSRAAEAYIRRRAAELGVNPDIAVSVWRQESGGSTDLGMRGQTIERGKWKGHYARGPWQIMSFHGPIPDTFEGQTDWALGHLKERGVRGYYGEGTPGVAGHPSTDQYEAQVLARAGVDPRMAGDMTGAPAVSPHTLPDKMQMAQNMYPSDSGQQVLDRVLGLLTPPQQQQRPPFADELFALGAGILGAKPGQNFASAAGQGLMQQRQFGQEQDVRRQTANTYAAQTMLQALNQMGYTQPDSYEIARAREPATFVDPSNGQMVSGFINRQTGRAEDYQGNPIPSNYVDASAMPRQAGSPSQPKLPADVQKAQFLFPDDEEAQRKYLLGQGKDGKEADPYAPLFKELDDLVEELDASPGKQRALGTFGRVGAAVSGWAGLIDSAVGTDLSSQVAGMFGGADPVVIQTRLKSVVVPVAKKFADPKGPLAQNERDQAKQMLTLLSGDGPLAPKQAMEVLRTTARLAKSYGEKKGQSTPPSMETTPPQDTGLPPGWSVEVSP